MSPEKKEEVRQSLRRSAELQAEMIEEHQKRQAFARRRVALAQAAKVYEEALKKGGREAAEAALDEFLKK